MIKRKIIYTGPFDSCLCDGVSASSFDLLNFLKQEGHEVAIISFMHDYGFSLDSLKDFLKSNNIHDLSFRERKLHYIRSGIDINIEFLPYSRTQVLGNHPVVLKKYLTEIGKHKGSHFISTDADLSTLMALVLSESNFVHYVRSPQLVVDTYKGSPLLKNILRGKSVIVNSEFSRKNIEEELGIHSSFTLYPFIDGKRCKIKQFDNTRISYNIGYYSAGKHKGDEILNYLVKKLPYCNFIIMGVGTHNNTTMKGDNVRLLGRTTDLQKFYNEVSIMLVPSIIPEGYSRIILESAFNGIPVIANRIGGIPEAIDDSGILIDMEESIEAISNKYAKNINDLLTSPILYEFYKNKALQRSELYQKHIFQMTRDFICKFF